MSSQDWPACSRTVTLPPLCDTDRSQELAMVWTLAKIQVRDQTLRAVLPRLTTFMLAPKVLELCGEMANLTEHADPLPLSVATESEILVLAFLVPEVPVTVNVEVPGVAVLLAVSVSMLEAVDVGVNDSVTPLGRPVAVNATEPVTPFAGIIVNVSVALAPWETVSEEVVSDSVKAVLAFELTKASCQGI